ncbi:MAG: endolytic transglycosylase MltG [Pseudohongiellaceae bacterium]
MRNRLISLFTLAAATLLLAGMLLINFWWEKLNAPLLIGTNLSFEVPDGMAFNALAEKLEYEGLLPGSTGLRIWAKLKGLETRVRAGQYELIPGLTPLTLMDKLVRGDVQQYRIRLIEGWTLKQVLEEIQNSERISVTLSAVSYPELAHSLGLEMSNPEGMFFPDTYQYTANTTDLEILKRANLRMLDVMEQTWMQRLGALPFETPYSALILASIVEKETAASSERPQIAGVFIRRLENGMRLQSDPTVIYGIGEVFDGNLRREDLQNEENLYNTYRHNGLPPTPIALVGRASLEAVLQPEPGDHLYFVSRGDGTHYFSSTLEEHNLAVRRYQLEVPDNQPQ